MKSEGLVVDPDPSFWTKTSRLQLYYGLWVNLTMMSIGLIFGFSAVAIPQLEETTMKMTVEQEAMITSMVSLTAPIGCIISGVILDRYGRKLGLVLCQIPIGFGWIYMALADEAKDLIVGRIISGIGFGMAMVAPRAYTTEITLPNMRGIVGTIPSVALSCGISVQAILGSFLKWDVLCYISGAYALFLLVINWFLPETPYYVLLKTRASKAKNVLMKFRSKSFNVTAELNELKEFQRANKIRRLSFKGTLKMVFKKSSCKPFSTILFFITLGQCSGVNVVMMWAIEILLNAKSSVDAHVGNIILAITRIVGGLIATWLLFIVGRRPIALVSAIGLGCSSIFLGTYLLTTKDKTVYPQLFFIAYILFATLGYYNLPFLMMFELLPLQVRGILSGVLLTIFNLLAFVMNETYPTLRSKIGLANVLLGYGTVSILGGIVLYFILPETKDLTLQEIEEYYNTRRPTLVSQRQVMSVQLHPEPNEENEKHHDKKHSKHTKHGIETDSDHKTPGPSGI